MSNLLKAGFRRYVRHPFTWLALAATIVVAVMNGSWARQWYVDDMYIIYQLIIFSVLYTWIVGREHEEGIFRNKIVTGHSKASIIISEIIIALTIGIMLFMIHAVIFAAFNTYMFNVLPLNVLLRIFVDVMLVNIIYIIIFVAVSALFSHKAVGVILGIVLIFGIYTLGYILDGILAEEEYTYTIFMEEVEKVDEQGRIYLDWEMSRKDETENPRYVEGWLRKCVEVSCNIVPNTHISDYILFLYDYFGYENYESETGVVYYDAFPTVTKLNDAENHMINENLVYAFVVLGLVGTLGYNLFRKKDFK